MTKGLPDNKETEKACPNCGARLLIKTNRTTETQFLGCPRWPECNHTEPIPKDMEMRLRGAATLFDMSFVPTQNANDGDADGSEW